MKSLEAGKEVARRQTPEERELEKKRAELAALEGQLAERELELATLRAELAAFERKYLSIVGRRYAELDELEAQIAEAEARLNPKDAKAQQKAAEEREKATESAHAAGVAEDSTEPKTFKPSESLKKLYREAAKALHPDLAGNDEDRARRERFMAEANAAYEKGDEEKLRAILREWESSPESVKGDGTAAELVRTIRKIARVEERLRAIEGEISGLKSGDTSSLKFKAEEAEREGRNLLDEMASRLEANITIARKKLDGLNRKVST